MADGSAAADRLLSVVTEFCRLMGLSVASLPAMIELEGSGQQSRILCFEQHGEQLLVLMSRILQASDKVGEVRTALTQCHYRKQSTMQLQVGLGPGDALVWIARLPPEKVSVTQLERVVNQLTRLHDSLS